MNIQQKRDFLKRFVRRVQREAQTLDGLIAEGVQEWTAKEGQGDLEPTPPPFESTPMDYLKLEYFERLCQLKEIGQLVGILKETPKLGSLYMSLGGRLEELTDDYMGLKLGGKQIDFESQYPNFDKHQAEPGLTKADLLWNPSAEHPEPTKVDKVTVESIAKFGKHRIPDDILVTHLLSELIGAGVDWDVHDTRLLVLIGKGMRLKGYVYGERAERLGADVQNSLDSIETRDENLERRKKERIGDNKERTEEK